MDSGIITIMLPLALAIIMIGLGLELTPKDFARVSKHPKAVLVALFCQLVLLVGIAFVICKVLNLPPLLAVGLMLLAASPGGSTANLFSYLFKGDVALNITLTATNSIISTLTLPFIINFSLMYFLQTSQPVDMPAMKMMKVFFITLLPVSMGMFLRYYFPKLADRLNRPMRILSASCLLFIFFLALYLERHNFVEYVFEIGPAVALFCFCSMFIGFFVPHLANIPEKQALTCSFEITIHNTALAITVALSVLGNTAMAIPAGIYSIFMFVFAALLGLLISRRNDSLLFKKETAAE